ncbi:MAG: DNA polymerase III subunit beta [Phycisphaerales bacterium]
MKVICDRSALMEALNLVSGVIVQRTPKPILTCVKLSAADGALTLAGTDLEVGLKLSTEKVDIQDDGEALIPADKLIQICRESNDPTLAIEVNDDIAHIRGSDSHFTIYGHAPADFPTVAEIGDADPDFSINSEDLRTLIARTLFATARENSRYAINGVLVKRSGKKLEFVATDGRRLALSRGSCSSAASGDSQCIVPTKALNLISKLTSDEEAPVSVIIDDNQATFIVGEAGSRSILSTNLVEGAFPPYEDVIPKDLDKKATFEVDTLTSAVRRAALLTNEESKGVRMAFQDGNLKITSRAPELGEAEINVGLDNYAGDDVEIGFNPTFIVEALKVIETPQVTFELKAPNKPGMIKSGPDFVYILMPVSLN